MLIENNLELFEVYQVIGNFLSLFTLISRGIKFLY